MFCLSSTFPMYGAVFFFNIYFLLLIKNIYIICVIDRMVPNYILPRYLGDSIFQ